MPHTTGEEKNYLKTNRTENRMAIRLRENYRQATANIPRGWQAGQLII